MAIRAARPSGLPTSSTTPFLPRFSLEKIGLPGVSAVSGQKVRVASPAALSILMTLAPQSAITAAQPGPAIQVDHSTTLRSDSRGMGGSLRLGVANIVARRRLAAKRQQG